MNYGNLIYNKISIFYFIIYQISIIHMLYISYILYILWFQERYLGSDIRASEQHIFETDGIPGTILETAGFWMGGGSPNHPFDPSARHLYKETFVANIVFEKQKKYNIWKYMNIQNIQKYKIYQIMYIYKIYKTPNIFE